MTIWTYKLTIDRKGNFRFIKPRDKGQPILKPPSILDIFANKGDIIEIKFSRKLKHNWRFFQKKDGAYSNGGKNHTACVDAGKDEIEIIMPTARADYERIVSFKIKKKIKPAAFDLHLVNFQDNPYYGQRNEPKELITQIIIDPVIRNPG